MTESKPINEEVFVKISEIIVENAGIAAEKITPLSRFQDLGLDSLDALAMISDLEKEYNIKIPNQEILQLKTVGEAVESISKRLQ